MAENSKIEWTTHTFNPWIGCQKVGPGCDNCYAETWDARGLQQRESRWGAHATRTRTSAANWRKPLAWNKAAAGLAKRPRVFCASLADVFDNHASILPEWRADLWRLIHATPHLDWLLLTKRPQNIAKFLPGMAMELGWETPAWGAGYPNVWLGCTVVNQGEADRDIPKLMAIPAKVRFLSMEPLLGPVNLLKVGAWFPCYEGEYGHGSEYLTALNVPDPTCQTRSQIHWIIVGGESGPKARPMHPDWARSIRDQCAAAGVEFHFKQWGEWAPGATRQKRDSWTPGVLYEATTVFGQAAWIAAQKAPWSYLMERIGKKAAGRLLDGVEHNGFPVAQA